MKLKLTVANLSSEDCDLDNHYTPFWNVHPISGGLPRDRIWGSPVRTKQHWGHQKCSEMKNFKIYKVKCKTDVMPDIELGWRVADME